MPDPPPITVVLADDHYLVREGVRQLLELDGAVQVVAAVCDAGQLAAAVEAQRPDVVITDIRMPPTHTTEGIEAAHRLRRSYPDLGVVVLSNHADPAYALSLFRDGMERLSYLLKERIGDREQLVAAVRAVASGGSLVDPAIVDALVRRGQRQACSPLQRLTDRERSVLAAMASGLSNPGIGDRLHLSVSAVEKHIGSIFTKLDLGAEESQHRRVSAVLAYLAHAQ